MRWETSNVLLCLSVFKSWTKISVFGFLVTGTQKCSSNPQYSGGARTPCFAGKNEYLIRFAETPTSVQTVWIVADESYNSLSWQTDSLFTVAFNFSKRWLWMVRWKERRTTSLVLDGRVESNHVVSLSGARIKSSSWTTLSSILCKRNWIVVSAFLKDLRRSR